MNQYLDAASKAARAAGALVCENFGRPLKVNVEEAHDIKLELDVRSQALITDHQGTRAPINILKAEFDNLRASQQRVLLPGEFVESADREPGQQRVIEDSTAGVVTWFTILTLHSEPEATNQVIAAPSAIDSLNVRPIAIAS
jgi:hypothetical protein